MTCGLQNQYRLNSQNKLEEEETKYQSSFLTDYFLNVSKKVDPPQSFGRTAHLVSFLRFPLAAHDSIMIIHISINTF